MKTTMAMNAVQRTFAVGMSKKFLPPEVICSFHFPEFDVLCPFVTQPALPETSPRDPRCASAHCEG
jgi:hypothetical protein